MPIPLYRVDAFTDQPFAGNPAAVCLLPGPRDERWMHCVAQEMNLPATAFVHPQGTGFALRWLMPAFEMSLCGHGTIAASHVVFSEGLAGERAEVTFETRHRGTITARRDAGWIWIDLAADPAQEAAPPEGLLEALGVQARAVARSSHDYIVEVESPAAVEAAVPNLEALRAIEARGVALTARSDGEYDFVSRVFEPAIGVAEDHATGSVHCVLAPYWADRLGRAELSARQASPRGGVLRLEVAGDRVRLGGRAVTVAKGSIPGEDE